MSIKLMTMAWSVDASHADKLVLLALADNANDDGLCYPSLATIAKKCGMHRATVLRAIEWLEENGHLTRQLRTGRSTIYRIHPQVADVPRGTDDQSQKATGPSSRERPVAQSNRSQRATTPVAESDYTSSAVRPDQSLCATHNRQVTLKEPSGEACDARARARTRESSGPLVEIPERIPGVIPVGTGLTAITAEEALVELREGWKRDVPGICIKAFQAWIDDLAERGKVLNTHERIYWAKFLAGQGDDDQQQEIVDFCKGRYYHLISLEDVRRKKGGAGGTAGRRPTLDERLAALGGDK